MENRKKEITLLLVVSALIRCFLASWIELGNDEVYYWTYALFPDWSHFDHPGMVGWVIQLFTLNLRLDSAFFLRLASVVFMTLNTWIVFRIGKELKDETTGLHAALLFTGSLYAFVITGIFILPDTPQSLCWMFSFWMLIRYLKRPSHASLLLAGLGIGLCILSKYTGAFLWVGFGLYLLLFDRKQLKNPYLYLAIAITAVCCLPILYWNMENGFVSFRFHGNRVSLFGTPHLETFGAELLGDFIYNNPVNVVLAIIAVVALFRKRLPMPQAVGRLTLLTALPMIGLFLLFSLTRHTLPHWSAPAFSLLIFPAAVWLGTAKTTIARRWLTASIAVLILALTIGCLEIKTGFIPLDRHTDPTEIGKDDFTLDLYGWEQLGEKFAQFREEKIAEGMMAEDDAIIGHNWFPMASIDYYVARPLGMKVLGYGPLDMIHKYLWINEARGGFELGADYWYLDDSRFFIDPEKAYAYTNFKSVSLIGVIPIERQGKTVRNIFVYKCKSLVYGPPTLEELRIEN